MPVTRRPVILLAALAAATLATAEARSQSLTGDQLEAVRRGAADVTLRSGPFRVPLVGKPTLPLVDVTIGSESFRFLLDLGSNVVIVRRDVADRAGMEIVLDRDATDIVRADSIAIGSAVFRDVWMGAYDELDVDGVIGYNLLSGIPFEIDYPGGTFALGSSAATGEDLEFVVQGRMPYLPGRIGERDVLLNLDTGATDAITVPDAWAEWLPIEGEPKPGPTLHNEQTGAHEVRVARLAANLRVGDLVLERPEVYLNPTVEDAWLGSGVLKEYVVSIDPLARRVRLTRPHPEIVPRDSVGSASDRILGRYEDYGFGGAALIAFGDTLAWAGGYGLADRAAGVRVRPGTVFPLASLTKPFTAAAVLRLVEGGVVRLEDPLGSVFDGLPPEVSAITLHHLLTHASGLPENPPEAVTSRADLLDALRSTSLEFEPGTDFEYGNFGYAVAAAVVEEVSGEPYTAFLLREIVAPAGDLVIGFSPDAFPDSLVAVGYTGLFGSGEADEAHRPGPEDWTRLGASGLFGSLPDLWRWARALREGRILAPGSVTRIFTPYANDYGYGWFLWETPRGTTEVIHGGDTEGFQSYLAFFEGDGFALAVATNDQRGWRGPVYSDLVRLVVEGQIPDLPPPTVAPHPDALARNTGTWTLPEGGAFRVEAVEGGLRVGAVGQRAASLLVSADAKTAERLEAVNRRTEAFVRALVEGDSTTVREVLGPSGRAGDFFDLVWSRLAADRIPDGFEVLGSVPSRAGRDVAYVRLRFGDAEETLRLVWRPELNGWGTGGGMPRRVFHPIGDGAYAAFDLFTRATVRIRFDGGRLEFPGVEGAPAARPEGSDRPPGRVGHSGRRATRAAPAFRRCSGLTTAL